MSGHQSAMDRYVFTNVNVLANLFETRTAAGSVAQNGDSVRITDNGLITWDVDTANGIAAADIKSIQVVAKAGGTPPTSAKCFIGLADVAGADQDYANLTNFVGFLVPGAASGGALSLQAKASVDSGALAVGLNLLTTWQRFVLNLVENTVTVGPPSASKSGRANVKASVGNADGYVRHIDVATALDIDSFTGKLQPMIMNHGATFNLDVKEICIEYNSY